MATTYLACLSPYELKCFVELILKGDELNKTQDICKFTLHSIITHKKSIFVLYYFGIYCNDYLCMTNFDVKIYILSFSMFATTIELIPENIFISFQSNLVGIWPNTSIV